MSDYDRRRYRLERQMLPTGEFEDRPTGTKYELDSGLWMSVDHRSRDGAPHARMEFSVPRLWRGTNVRGAPLSRVFGAVQYVHDLGAAYVTWRARPLDLAVTRLDLVRDFAEVDNPGALLAGLATIPGRRCGPTNVYSDPRRGGAQTLRRGNSDRWSAHLYDKHREACSVARREREPERRAFLLRESDQARGVLRCEVRLRAPVLQERRISTLKHLREPDLDDLARTYIQRCAFDSTVAGADRIDEIVATADPQDLKQLPQVLGQMLLASHGHYNVGGCKDTLRARRQKAREWGLSPATLALADSPDVRLDYDRGALVTD